MSGISLSGISLTGTLEELLDLTAHRMGYRDALLADIYLCCCCSCSSSSCHELVF